MWWWVELTPPLMIFSQRIRYLPQNEVLRGHIAAVCHPGKPSDWVKVEVRGSSVGQLAWFWARVKEAGADILESVPASARGDDLIS